jgi:alkaline phosphatase D
MTDNRYERSPDNAPDNEDKTYLGTKQMAWLKRELLASKAPVKVLASGGEFESYGVKNSWANFKHARDELFKFIEDNHITGVLLISGDRHFTAAYQVSGKFIEVTSGPTGSKFAEAKLNPEVFFYGSKGKYFCIYDIDTRPVEPVATIEIYKTADGLIERRTFSWDEVLGKKKIEPLTSANKSRVEK